MFKGVGSSRGGAGFATLVDNVTGSEGREGLRDRG